MAGALLLLAGAGFTLTSWNKTVERHDRELETMVVMGAQAVDTYLSTLEKTLAGLAATTLLTEGITPRIAPEFAKFKKRYPEFEIVVLADPDGTVLATSEGKPTGLQPNIGGEPSFIDARAALLNGASMAVSRPFIGPLSGTITTPLRYGVRDAGGKLLYVLGGGLSQARTHAFWSEAPLPPAAAMGIIRDDMYVVARHPLPPERPTRIFTEPLDGLLPDHLRKGNLPKNGLLRGKSKITGEGTTLAFRRLPNYPLTFYVNNPQRNLYMEWWASTWPIYLLLLLTFGGGIAIIRWIERSWGQWRLERENRVAELTELALKLESRNLLLDEFSRRQRASNAALESTNAELEAFMYSVSHDLRAPLRAIDGYTAILQEELSLPEGSEGRRLFERIRNNSRRMSDLLNDLLDLSRYSTQELNREPVDMGEKVDSVVAELVDRSTGARFEIGTLPPCQGDRVLLRQVWINLIGNALKYSAKTEIPTIRIGFEDGAYFVADNGTGFDMAYADKLFKLFSRLHHEKEFEGTGVGLAIVKRVIERHGGRVSAQGTPGAGARFTFSITAPS